MSARIFHCAFPIAILFQCFFFCTVIDSLTSSLQTTNEHSGKTMHEKQFLFTTSAPPTTTAKVSVAPPTGIKDAIKDIAYYLRAHKFNEYDRRYEPNAEKAQREYYKAYPRPPLRSLHWEVHKYCDTSLIECVDYLRKRISRASLKRTDDTSIVMQEQQWNENNNSKQIEIVDEECKKMREADDLIANPFEGPLERFQWRTTASYFMCWYTMQSDALLQHLDERCDNFANCLDPQFGPNNRDVRARDDISFGCALYSFCPDPCCPFKHLARLEEICWNSADNPCFEANPAGRRQCHLNRDQNTNFGDLILNRWNVSCSCRQKGFEWNSLYGMCVDVDECASGVHKCDPEMEVCVNLPGKFKCACKWGHAYDTKTLKCRASKALEKITLNRNESQPESDANDLSLWKRILRFFSRKKKE